MVLDRKTVAMLCAPAALAAAAVGNATGGTDTTTPTLVAVGDGPAAIATGFAVSPGRVVTVAHVLEHHTLTVRGADGTARRAAVVRRDDRLDLALLAVPGLRLGARFAPAGTRVLVRRDGEQAALPARVVRRITARVHRAGADDGARRPALELAAAVRAGDSGAPVLRDGRVAGVVFARSHGRARVAYAVDASAIRALVR